MLIFDYNAVLIYITMWCGFDELIEFTCINANTFWKMLISQQLSHLAVFKVTLFETLVLHASIQFDKIEYYKN